MVGNILSASPISVDKTAQRALILPEGMSNLSCGQRTIDYDLDRFQLYLEVTYTQSQRSKFVLDVLSSIWEIYSCPLACSQLAFDAYDVRAGFRHSSDEGTTWLRCLLFGTATGRSVTSGDAIGGSK